MLAVYAFGFAVWKGAPLERLAIRCGRPGLTDYTSSHVLWHLAIFAAVRIWDGAWSAVLYSRWDAGSC